MNVKNLLTSTRRPGKSPPLPACRMPAFRVVYRVVQGAQGDLSASISMARVAKMGRGGRSDLPPPPEVPTG